MNKSRAEYFRKRRETKAQFMAMVEKEELEKLDEVLKAKGISRVAWLRSCINREIEK